MSLRAVAGSLILIGVALAVAWRGIALLRFEAVERAAYAVVDAPAQSAAARAKAIDAQSAALAPWTAALDMQERARQALAALARASGDRSRLEPAILDSLRAKPTDGLEWLALAKARWDRSAPIDAVAAAVDMSIVVAPREQEAMRQRVLFLAPMWELLPPDMQRQFINHLVELDWRLGRRGTEDLAAILTEKPEETLAEIRSLVVARGAEKLWVERLGLR